MRRLFTLPTARSVLATATFARWQSETAKPKEGDEAHNRIEIEADAKAKGGKSTGSSEIDKVKKAIAENKKLFDEVKKDILYTAANAENARREYRQAVEKEKFNGENAFAKELFQSADALDAVCKTIATYRDEHKEIPGNIASLLSGVDLSLKVVLKVLSRYGITRMETKIGDAFDADTMDSILTTPATETVKAGQVSDIVKAGYVRKGEVLRRAQVGVAEDPEKQS